MTAEPAALREPIARSWSRCSAEGLDPADPGDRFAVHETDPGADLARAARPVLDALADDLADIRVAAILTDADANITTMRFGTRRLRPHVETAGAVVGRRFAERETGTNAIATVHATGRDLAVEPEEHYLERWRRYACYGHPVHHPVSGELLGVLDLTAVDGASASLLAPLVRRAVRDIRAELLAGSDVVHRRLLAAYQDAVGRDGAPVLVLGHDLVLADRRSSDLLGAADHDRLRGLLADGRAPADAVVELSGGPTRVRCRAVPETDGAVLHLHPLLGAPPGPAMPRRVGMSGAAGSAVLIAGEPGTGRTATMRELIAGTPATVLEATDLTPTSEHDWMVRAARSMAAPGETTVVEDVHLLLESTATRLRRLLPTPHARLVLTSCPVDDLGGEGAALAAACGQRIDLPPLRARAHEIGTLATALLDARRADTSVRFTAEALDALAAHRWPGNLRELADVVAGVAARRSAGDIGAADLPSDARRSASAASESPGDLARVERETIEAALRACGGNKLRAARRLGISRSTLYTRLRTLHITV